MPVLQEQIIDYLMGLIEHGQHDDMLPSQNQLREHFNVSTVTVRGALDKLVSRGLIYRRQGKGCFIRKVGNQLSVERIFLILPAQADVNGEFVMGLFNAARERSYHMIFYHYDGNEEALQHELRQAAPSAAIWLAPNLYRDAETITRLAELNLHLLLFNRVFDYPAISYVSGDFRCDGCALGQALAAHGVRRVLYLCYDMRIMFAALRCEGLREALAAAGASVDTIGVNSMDTPDEILVASAVALLRKEHYDAVVCAQGAIWSAMGRALHLAGCDPEAMWFGSFNAPAAGDETYPRTIWSEQPVAAMAVQAVELIDRLLAGGAAERLLVPARMQYSSLPMSEAISL